MGENVSFREGTLWKIHLKDKHAGFEDDFPFSRGDF